jgi:hypothetical protein
MAAGKRAALENLWATDVRVAPWAGTEYGVLAAMNTYQQHIQDVRGMGRPERNALNMVEGGSAKADHLTMAVLAEVKETGKPVPADRLKVLARTTR